MVGNSDSLWPHYEYLVIFQTARDPRQLSPFGPPTRRYFRTASDAHAFVVRLDAAEASQLLVVKIARSEVGSWETVERLPLEAAAAMEAGI